MDRPPHAAKWYPGYLFVDGYENFVLIWPIIVPFSMEHIVFSSDRSGFSYKRDPMFVLASNNETEYNTSFK